MTEGLVYENKRIDFFVDVALVCCSLATSMYYQTSYRNLNRLKPLRERGFVLLPNHQSNADILFEGIMLHKALGKKPHWVMKNGLPGIFDYVGGIRTIRRKDLGKPMSREDKRMALERAKGQRDYVLDAIYQLLSDEEVVILHQQGNRAYKKPYEINLPNLRKLLVVQERLGMQIPFVPLTISYEDVKQLFSKVIVNVGNPIQVPNNGLDALAEHLMKEIHLEL
jgi:hypothetical protein